SWLSATAPMTASSKSENSANWVELLTFVLGGEHMTRKPRTVPVRPHRRSTPSTPAHPGPGKKPGPKTVPVPEHKRTPPNPGCGDPWWGQGEVGAPVPRRGPGTGRGCGHPWG